MCRYLIFFEHLILYKKYINLFEIITFTDLFIKNIFIYFEINF